MMNSKDPENTVPERGELALADFDHLPVATLPMRITPLTQPQVLQLLQYERAHGDRLPVKVVLEARIEALRGGAEPSGTIAEQTPEVDHTQHGSAIKRTSAAKVDTPSLGGPINPSQPHA